MDEDLQLEDVSKRLVELGGSLDTRLSTAPLRESEAKILDLYDLLQERKLERTLLEVQRDLGKSSMTTYGDIDHLMKIAREECLEASSAYLLKRSIIQGVLSVDPFLKAVHSGSNGSPVEREIQPLADQRDILSIIHATLSSSLRSTWSQVMTLQADNLMATRRNQSLAAALINLTEQLKEHDLQKVDDIELRRKLEDLRYEGRESFRRRRIIKSVVGAVIAGSGVDWASRNDLRNLVLNSED